MKQDQILLNIESDEGDYLGVFIDRRPNGSIIMRQEVLAKWVVEALFMDTNNHTSTIVHIPGTLDKGLVLLKPIPLEEQQFSMGIFVYAAFAYGWGTEQGTNPSEIQDRLHC